MVQCGDERLRDVASVFARRPSFTGNELRRTTGLDTKALNGVMSAFAVQVKQVTGHSFDVYFKRKRVYEDGQRVKSYQRTKAGETLAKDLQTQLEVELRRPA